MEIVVPERINSTSAYALLSQNLPSLSLGHAIDVDMLAKEAWKERNIQKAYYLKIVAAKSFEKIVPEVIPLELKFRVTQNAAYSYDKAAKNAVLLGFIPAAIKCRIRACLLHKNLLNLLESSPEQKLHQDEISRVREDLGYSASHLTEIINRNTANWLQYGISSMNRPYNPQFHSLFRAV